MDENQMHDGLNLFLDELARDQQPDAGSDLAGFAREIHARHGSERLDPARREGILRALLANAAAPELTTGGAGPLSQPTLLQPGIRNPWHREAPDGVATKPGPWGTVARAQMAIAIVLTMALLVVTVSLVRDQDRRSDPDGTVTYAAAVPTQMMTATVHSGWMAPDIAATGEMGMPSNDAPATTVPGMASLASATPWGTPASEGWLAPITPVECEIRDAGSGSTVEDLPERAYAPFSASSARDAESAATTLRQYEACRLGVQDVSGYTSPRFDTDTLDVMEDMEAQTARGQEVSAAYAGMERADFIVIEGPEMTPVPSVRMRIREGIGLFQPRHAVQLVDGRIAIPTTQVYPGWFETDGPPLFMGNVTVLIEVDGRWLIDERLPFCIGQCDELWSWLQSPATPPSTIATPYVTAVGR